MPRLRGGPRRIPTLAFALAGTALLLVDAATPLAAQLIHHRTLPISHQHQFDVFPSRTLGMGGVAIAVSDDLLDPFTNPAKGTRVDAPRLFGAPGIYRVSGELGGGWTLPLGTLAKRGPWFGGLAAAFQEVDPSRNRPFGPNLFLPCPDCGSADLDLEGGLRSLGNRYAFALAGRDLPASGLSFAASAFWAGLKGMDGVDLLYPGGARIGQSGRALDVRFGALKEWEGEHVLEVLLLHHRSGMNYDVIYLDRFWDPGEQQLAQRPREERSLDGTRAWGLHAEYRRPLPAEGWTLGWLGTVNRSFHPAIPDFELARLPLDRGHSTAVNLGTGMARTRDGSTLALDVIYEPIRHRTRAHDGTPAQNLYRFSNTVLRAGASRELELDSPGTVINLQLGLQTRAVQYRLSLRGHSQLEDRDEERHWVEWGPTWGLALRMPAWEIRYGGRVTRGTARPGVEQPAGFPCVGLCTLPAPSRPLPAGPGAPLAFQPVRVLQQQVSITLPFR